MSSLTIYGFARLTPVQQAALLAVVRNKRVVDLGSGEPFLANFVAQRATAVVAVDKNRMVGSPVPNVTLAQECTFRDFAMLQQEFDVALLSWPINNPSILDAIPILRRCATVIYLGVNWGGTACGVPGLWEYLVTRQLITFLDQPACNMLIYGEACSSRSPHQQHNEEVIGTTQALVSTAPTGFFRK